MATVLRFSRPLFPLACGTVAFLFWGCSSNSTDGGSTALTAGGSAAGGTAGTTASVGGAATGGAANGGVSTGFGGSVPAVGGSAGTTNMGGSVNTGGTPTGGTAQGGMAAGGMPAGGGGASGGSGGVTGGAGGAAQGGASGGTGGSSIPAGYMGTPYTTIQIPGTFFAADYDRGGPGVAYCHNVGDCAGGITTNDWYAGNTPGPYRAPMPATATICNGAACDDNVGLCRMNPNKPDKTIDGMALMDDVYLGYMGAGEWIKYTVQVMEAGTYSIGVFIGAPNGASGSWDFGGGIMTGSVALPESSTANCGCGESYHSWAQRDNLAMVTFPSAGTYLMTFTTGSSLNIDKFTFTKM